MNKMEEMQRSDAKKRANRSLSITMLIASIILICCSIIIILSCVKENIRRKELLEIHNQLLIENKDFERINEHLKEDNYYNIYVREEYQLNGDNVIRLPR